MFAFPFLKNINLLEKPENILICSKPTQAITKIRQESNLVTFNPIKKQNRPKKTVAIQGLQKL